MSSLLTFLAILANCLIAATTLTICCNAYPMVAAFLSLMRGFFGTMAIVKSFQEDK